MRSLLLLIPLFAVAAACSPPPKACRVGADCASGVCLPDGSCGAVTDEEPDPDGGATDASVTVQDGGDAPDGGADGGGGVTCSPNHDGTITAAELPIRAGLRATYRIAQDVTFSTAGVEASDGGRVWSFEGALAGDTSAPWETESTNGAWYAADFPSATYAARLSSSSELRGVFEAKEDGLYLLGVVSVSAAYPNTRLSYSPAVKVFALPMSEGTAWETASTVSGTYAGAAAYYTERYDSLVDAHGVAKTPFGDFPVLRVRTVMVRSGNVFTTTRTFAFASECFSAVAQVVSQAGETSVEFTQASEVRRLSP